MKLIERLDTLFSKFMGNEIFYKESTIKALISKIVNKDLDELNSREEVYILLKAMVNASKADGVIDRAEQKKVIEFMGDMSNIEKIFVENELTKPMNFEEFVKEIPVGMEQQVYYMSLFAIDLDTDAEREYLQMLANRLGIAHTEVNDIHESLEADAA